MPEPAIGVAQRRFAAHVDVPPEPTITLTLTKSEYLTLRMLVSETGPNRTAGEVRLAQAFGELLTLFTQ